MPIFRDWGSKFPKANVTFEISTFKIGYKQNSTKIRKFIFFGLNLHYKFSKNNVNLKFVKRL